jgi:hypothetical protein
MARESKGRSAWLVGLVGVVLTVGAFGSEAAALVCVKGGKADDVVCQALLVCRGGSALEKIDIVRTRRSKKPGKD